MRTKFKPWALPFLKEHCDIAYPSFKKDKFFNDDLEIEIGGGKGDFIISQAVKHPNTHFLMIERVISVAAPATKKLIENGTKIICEASFSFNGLFLNLNATYPSTNAIAIANTIILILTSPVFALNSNVSLPITSVSIKLAPTPIT